MPSYRIIWAIDVDADTPQVAAARAWEFLHNEPTTATVFDVLNEDTGDVTTIDLWNQLYGKDGSSNESEPVCRE